MQAAPPLAAADRVSRVSRSLPFLALLSLAVVFGMMLHQGSEQRDRVLDETRTDLSRLAMVFAEQTGRAVETADVILREIADLQHVPVDQRPPHRTPLGIRLQQRIEGISQIVQIKLADADGTILAATGSAPARLPPEGLELISRFRSGPSESLLISTPFRATGGEWIVLLARPFLDPQDRFGGIVVAALALRYFEEFYRAVDLDDDGEIVLARRDGVVLSAFPPRPDAVGGSFAGMPAFAEAAVRAAWAPGGAGTFLMERPSDGGKRVVAIRTLRRFPFTIHLSQSADAVLRDWRRQIGSAAVFGLVIAGTIAALLVLIARESRRVAGLLAENTAARGLAEAATLRITQQLEERERAETALRQAQRLEAIGQLTGGVAHDFNNLLTVLLGNIELMQATLPEPAKPADMVTRTRLQRMQAAAERGATLTDQLLAFARRQPLVPRAADLNTVINGMLDLLRSAVGGNIEVDLALDEALWPVLVDTTQIELVILNLALNARDATAGGGRIWLETANVTLPPAEATPELPAGDYVAVRLRDAGAGMSPEVKAHAFEPFFTTKGPSQGSGLGLSQVYGVARQSGGCALIESEPGHGSIVSVLLPRASAEPGDGPRLDGAGLTVGARVLLVDDDEAVRTTTALILEAAGYVIFQADGAPTALAMIREGTPLDLLLTDVAMPETNGAELADQVRALLPGLPIVFISGYADPNAIAGRDMQPLVRKPFRVLDLTAQIETALREGSRAAR